MDNEVHLLHRAIVFITALLFLVIASSTPRAQDYDDDDRTTDTLDQYLEDDLLRLKLKPLDLGTCSVDQLARLPGMDIGRSMQLLDAIDRGDVRTWAHVRHVIPINRETLGLLQAHTRLPRQRHEREARGRIRFDAGISLPGRLGGRSQVQRITDNGTKSDTVVIGTKFVGSPASLRMEGVLSDEAVSIAFRASKESWEPWFYDDTLAYVYDGSRVLRMAGSNDSSVRRRGGSIGVSAGMDQPDWGVTVGDYRLNVPVPMESIIRAGSDLIRRAVIPGAPLARSSPSFSDLGFLRGILLRLGPEAGRTVLPNIAIGISAREYASSSSSPLDVSTGGTLRTRPQLRRSGSIHEEGLVMATRFERRRWGADLYIQHWRRSLPLTHDTSAEDVHYSGSLWFRIGQGIARASGMLVSQRAFASAGIVIPIGPGAEVTALGRYGATHERIVLPGGIVLPEEGLEWSVAGSWRESKFEETDVTVGSRGQRVSSSSPFGGMTTYAGLTRTERESSTLRRMTLRLESTPAGYGSARDGRRKSADEIEARGGYRLEWWKGPVRVVTDVQASMIDISGASHAIASAGSASLTYRWKTALTARGRISLYAAESPATIYDVAPSFRGRSMPLTLSGRGARLNVELRAELDAKASIALGLEHRNRSDRSRIVDSGDDLIDSPDVTSFWFSAQLQR